MMVSLSISVVVWLQTILTIPIDSIESKQTSPIAPIGGVLLVQLVSEELGDNWPATINVSYENGSRGTGHVGWIEKNTNNSSWTSNPLSIRPIDQSDNTKHIHPLDAMSGPVLLVDLPNNCRGPIHFCGTSIDPTWVTLPKTLPTLNIFPIDTNATIPLQTSFHRPEWNSLEYWRWALVASRLGTLPPPPPNDSDVARLSAMHGEQLWRIGFDKLSKSSRGVAAACRDLLTNVAIDGDNEFACWIVQPNLLNRLLSIITDQSATSREITLRALRWSEEQQPFIQWIEGVYGNQVTIATTNPTLEPSLATIVWRENDEFPIAIELPASETVRSKINRVEPIDLSLFGPQTLETSLQWLDVQVGMQQYSIPIVPTEVIVLPPYTMLSQLHPLWTLRSVHRGIPKEIQQALSTTVQVRKLLGVWELFIQCKGNKVSSGIPKDIAKAEDVIGVEAITLMHHETNAIVAIPPSGTFAGLNIPRDFRVAQSIEEDGWNVRIELPSEWISDERLSFSVARTHGDSTQVETAPLPCVPWNINPHPIVLDLSQWDLVQSIPTTSR